MRKLVDFGCKGLCGAREKHNEMRERENMPQTNLKKATKKRNKENRRVIWERN